jgi:hypothetical protein
VHGPGVRLWGRETAVSVFWDLKTFGSLGSGLGRFWTHLSSCLPSMAMLAMLIHVHNHALACERDKELVERRPSTTRVVEAGGGCGSPLNV